MVASDLGHLTLFLGQEPPAELLARLGDDERIVAVDRGDVAVVAPPGQAGPFALAVVGAVDGTVGGFGRPLIVAGRYPEAGAADEIMLNERGAEAAGLSVGDRVPMFGLPCVDDSCEEIDIGVDATVVGVVRTGADLRDDSTTQLIMLTGPSFADGRWREAARPGVILMVHAAADVDLPPLAAELSTEVGGLGNVAETSTEFETAARAAAMQADALAIAAALVTVAGAVVIVQTAARHLGRRPADTKTLMALGLARSQRMLAAATSLLPAVACGVVAGLGLAIIASPAFPLGATRRAEGDRGLRLDPLVLVVTACFATVLCTALVWAVAMRWSRTDASSAPARRSLIAVAVGGMRIRPPAATGARFALDAGTGTQRLPVAPTLLTVTAVVAVVVGAAVLSANLDRLLTEPARFGQPWVLAVTVDVDDPEATSRLAADERVEAADLARLGEVDLNVAGGSTTQVKAIGIEGVDGQPTSLVLLAGRAPAGIEEIAVADDTMADNGLKLGDRLEVGGPCGTSTVEVVGRAIAPIGSGDDPGSGVVMTLDGFDAVCAEQLAAEIDRVTGALLVLRDDRDAASFRAELEAGGMFVDSVHVPADVMSLGDVRSVPVAVAIVVGAFGIVAVGHALVLAVRRRRHELAVLRALGWRPSEAAAAIRWQAFTIALVAVLVGVPAGIVIGRTTWGAIARPIHVLPDASVPLVHTAVVAIVAVVVALALAWLPSRRASRLRAASVLRTE